MTDSLTLRCGTKPAKFQEMTVASGLAYQKAERAAHAAVIARYAEVHALESDEQRQHPDYADYDADYWVEAMVGPALRAAWDGDGPPPTDDDIRHSRLDSEVNPCLRAAIACNPILGRVFPRLVAPEPTDPNA